MPRFLTTVIALTVALCTGAKAATISYVGIPSTELEVITARMSPRLDYIKSRPASSWRADDAAFFLKRLLVRAGHADAKVDWDLPGGDVIRLRAYPGTRYLYGEIKADYLGPLSQEDLENYFLQPIVDTEIVEQKKAPYIVEYDERGADNVANYLKSQGYWKAEVTLVNAKYNRTERRVNIQLKVRPGTLYKLAPPIFEGADQKAIAEITADYAKYIGTVATTQNIAGIRTAVKDYYRNSGYQFARIFRSAKFIGDKERLKFRIIPGLRYTIDDVYITGNSKTKTRKIKRFFNSLRHEYYDESQVDEVQRKILATGAFSSAIITPIKSADGTLDLEVTIQEADAKSVSGYTGFGTFEGLILGASYTDLNFHGNLLRFNARGEFSNRGFLGETSITEPFFAGEPIQLSARLFLLQRIFEGYEKKELGIETSFTWIPKKEYSTRLYLGASYVDVTEDGLTPAELGPEGYLHTKIGIEQTIDLRDSAILPTKGFHGEGLLEFGTVSGSASTSYIKANLDTSYRSQLGEKNIFVTSFSAGGVKPGDDSNLPIDLRVFSGGSDSLRSFDERELGPRSLSNDPLGGQAYWVASAEYIRSISDPIKGVLFFDMGQVYQDFADFGFSNPSYAIGAGIRIDLPIGPVRLEYGHNLNPQSGEPSGTIHFAIGTTF